MFAAKTIYNKYLFRVPEIVSLSIRAVQCEHNWSGVSSTAAGVHYAPLSVDYCNIFPVDLELWY